MIEIKVRDAVSGETISFIHPEISVPRCLADLVEEAQATLRVAFFLCLDEAVLRLSHTPLAAGAAQAWAMSVEFRGSAGRAWSQPGAPACTSRGAGRNRR